MRRTFGLEEKFEIDFEGIPLEGMKGIVLYQAVEWRRNAANEALHSV